MEKSVQLVINPGRNPFFAKRLQRLMKFMPNGSIHESRDREHFQELVRNFINSNDSYLLVWGGDGTANMTINCLMKDADKNRRKKIAVGFLRGGSGNGTQDSYEVPLNLKSQVGTYLDSMEKNLTQRVDLLKIRFEDQIMYGQLFGSGLDSQILSIRNRFKRIGKDKEPRPGLLPYLIPAVKTVWRGVQLLPEPQIITMKNGRFAFRGIRTNAEFPFSEYKLETSAPMIEAGVRPYYGWFYKICPDVVCNDGLMDTYFFNITGEWRVLSSPFVFWNGQYHRINDRNVKQGLPLIEHYKISKMAMEPVKQRLFHIDGELFSTDSAITLGVKHRALKFLVPESYYQKFHPIHEWDERKK